jgi:hypothetical protein
MTLTDICEKANTIVILVVCLPWPLAHKLLPHMGIGRPPSEEPYGCLGVHTEDYMYRYTPGFTDKVFAGSVECKFAGFGIQSCMLSNGMHRNSVLGYVSPSHLVAPSYLSPKSSLSAPSAKLKFGTTEFMA